MYSVYIHTVKANGKKYIGQTKDNPKNRWGSNGCRYRGTVFYHAIQKYGWNNIDHEIVATGLTREEADKMEIDLIAKYKTNENKHGYNMTPGGRDGAGSSGGKNPNARSVICLETEEIWECANYCAKDINVNPASLQESLYNGYKCKGKHYKYVDDDKYQPNKEPHAVRCLETGQVWKNVKECAKDLGIHSRSVARYCSGLRKSKTGLTYEYCVV